MSRIKQIVFDCGGVFVDIQFRQLIEKLTGSKEAGEAFMIAYSPPIPLGDCAMTKGSAISKKPMKSCWNGWTLRMQKSFANSWTNGPIGCPPSLKWRPL